MKLLKNMGNKKVLIILSCITIIFGCKNFNYQSLEVDYGKGVFKISSDDYVIDSIIMSRQSEKIFVVSLIDKNQGTSMLNFREPNEQYNIHVDKLDVFCKKSKEQDWGSVEIFIRQRSFTEKYSSDVDYNSMQTFDYKYLPCFSSKVETLQAERYYK